MNRIVVFGVALFFAIVGIALTGGENSAVAGHGCGGCGGHTGHDCGQGPLKKLLAKHGCFAPKCCAPEPVCCEPEPVCCEPEPCCGGEVVTEGEVIIEEAPVEEAPMAVEEAPEAPAEADVPEAPAEGDAARFERAPVIFRKVSFRR